MMNSDWAVAVMVETPMVITAGEGMLPRVIVEVPITSADADGARETGVPDIVIAGPPGFKV